MPGFDGTGPAGAGPMTGWGMGPCGHGAGAAYARFYGRGMGFGRGMGMRFGRGHGCGRGYVRGFGPAYGPGAEAWTATETDPEGRKRILSNRRNALEAQIEAIDKRLGNR